MKVDVRLSLDGDLYVEIANFGRKEGIDDRQAIKWLIQEGIKSFNGIGGQTHLQAARLSGMGRKEK